MPPPGSTMPPGGGAPPPPPLLPPPTPPGPGTSVGVGSGVGTGVGPAAALHAARSTTASTAGSLRSVVIAARRRDPGSGSGADQRVDACRMRRFPGLDLRRPAEEVAELVRPLEQHDLREWIDVE